MEKSKLVILIAIVLSLVSVNLFAAQIKSLNEIEVSCRSKAKEEAANIFKGCMSENKSAQIELIKKDYQDRLKAIKDNYEKELKKLSSKSAKSEKAGKSERIEMAKKAQSDNLDTSEMTIDLKQNNGRSSDDSIMDIPEPMPLENL